MRVNQKKAIPCDRPADRGLSKKHPSPCETLTNESRCLAVDSCPREATTAPLAAHCTGPPRDIDYRAAGVLRLFDVRQGKRLERRRRRGRARSAALASDGAGRGSAEDSGR